MILKEFNMYDFDNGLINENNIDLLWSKMKKLQLKNNDNKGFYEQIQYFADMRWNGKTPMEINFNASYPTVLKMSKKQFEYYMYYRTQMLSLNFYMPKSISYIYTFLYEIVTGNEDVDSIRVSEILEYLINNLRKYFSIDRYGGTGDYGLTSKIVRWRPNIILLYEYKKQGKKSGDIMLVRYDKNELILWEKVANYYIEDSEFINKYCLLDDVKNVLNRIIEELEKNYMSKGIDIIRFLVGDLEKKVDYENFLPNSVWTNHEMKTFLPLDCASILYNPSNYEMVDIVDEYGNTIKRVEMSLKEVWNNVTLYILKSIEIDFMSCVGFHTRLRKPIVDKSKAGIRIKTYEGNVRCFSSDAKKRSMQYTFLCEISNILEIVDNTIGRFIDDNRSIFSEISQSVTSSGMIIRRKKEKKPLANEAKVITQEKIFLEEINKDTLQAAREVLHKNQERLVIEENDNNMLDNQEQLSIDTNSFSKIEVDLLKLLLNHANLTEYEREIQKSYFTINMVVEKLNRKSMDLIGDVAIENVDGTMEIIDDYIDICEKWVKCYGRKENSKED